MIIRYLKPTNQYSYLSIKTSYPKRIRERISKWNKRTETRIARQLGIRLFN